MHFYFNLFGINIPGYSLMIILGMMVANVVAFLLLRKYKMDSNDFIVFEGYMLLGAMIGAKLLYLWVARHEIDWSRFFELEYFNVLMKGGFVFYGGLIGGLLCVILASKIHKIALRPYIQKFIFLIPFVHAFGRIGCYCVGCCYGIPYEGVLAVHFPEKSFAPSGIGLFPVQLAEAVLLMILAIVIYIITRKSYHDYGIYTYFVGYSLIRFFLEYLRYDDARGELWIFSTSQWISIAIILGVCVLLIIKQHK